MRMPMPAVPIQRQNTTYRTLAESVRRFIAEGTLRPGEKLPSVRQMARQRGVSTGTVVKAYASLENLGEVEVRSQSGFYIRPRSGVEYPLPQMARPMARPSYVGVSDLAAEVMTSSALPANVAFGWSTPDAAIFPNRRIARMMASIIRDDPDSLARSTVNWGFEPLAREIARRYVHAGVALSHAEVLITVGCTEALNLSIRAVTKPGDTVAMETPVSFGLMQILQSLGVRVLEIPACPREGLQLEELRAALVARKITALFVMPNYQNPLGCSLSDAHKARLYALLQEFDIPAVEDDVYTELHFGAQCPRPLKAWDTDGRVLLCGSFAKTLVPGFRVGWCAPGRYLEPVRRLKMANTMGTPLVLQKTITDFLRIGGYDHHLRSLRRTYQQHLRLYSENLRRHCPPGTRLTQPDGGYVLWVQFPAAVDTVRLYHEALQKKVSIAPGILFSAQPRFNHCIRLNTSSPWSDRIQSALRLIGRLAAAQLDGAGEKSAAPDLQRQPVS
ncbi:transcriptional regulator, GntR family [Opitutus sp. GAS368]|nr:transcriptional regulator, GntR family [Opitutus sp. GAS368]